MTTTSRPPATAHRTLHRAPTRLPLPRVLALLAVPVVLAVGACADGSAATAVPPAPAPTAGAPSPDGDASSIVTPATDGTTPGVGDGTATVALTDDLTVAVTPPDDDAWETGRSPAAPVQWRPREGRPAEPDQPWADVLLYAAVGVVDPATGEDAPLPPDPASWLSSHPDVDVVAERDVDAAGGTARQLDVLMRADVDLLRSPDAAVESGAGVFERFTLVDVDGTVVVLQASSFVAADGVLPPGAGTAVYDDLLASLRPVG